MNKMYQMVPLGIFALIFVATATGTTAPFGWGNRSSYGGRCNRTMRCESGISLTCRNHVCECVKPDTMMFDPRSSRCVVFAQEKCRYLIDTSDLTEDAVAVVKTRRYEYDECVANAKCTEEGICACDPQYFESSNGSCLELGVLNGACELTNHCRHDLSLTCLNNTCQCDPHVSIFDDLTKGCVGLVGHPCLGSEGHCVENAKCKAPGEICECQEPFTPRIDGGGFCNSITFGGACANREDGFHCHSNFTCRNNGCGCKFDDEHQFYDKSSRTCRSFIAGPCKLEVNAGSGSSDQCIEKAKCAINPRTNLPECRCISPFVESARGLCEDLRFGARCFNSSHPAFIPCDQKAGLFCRDGQCNCGDELKVFDPEERRCRRLVGSLCYQDNSCIPGAICKKSYHALNSGKKKMPGQCECAKPENLTPRRTCSQDTSRNNSIVP